MANSYWRPYQYIIGACNLTNEGHPAEMFFSPDQNYFDCIPKGNAPAKSNKNLSIWNAAGRSVR